MGLSKQGRLVVYLTRKEADLLGGVGQGVKILNSVDLCIRKSWSSGVTIRRRRVDARKDKHCFRIDFVNAKLRLPVRDFTLSPVKAKWMNKHSSFYVTADWGGLPEAQVRTRVNQEIRSALETLNGAAASGKLRLEITGDGRVVTVSTRRNP